MTFEHTYVWERKCLGVKEKEKDTLNRKSNNSIIMTPSHWKKKVGAGENSEEKRENIDSQTCKGKQAIFKDLSTRHGDSRVVLFYFSVSYIELCTYILPLRSTNIPFINLYCSF